MTTVLSRTSSALRGYLPVLTTRRRLDGTWWRGYAAAVKDDLERRIDAGPAALVIPIDRPRRAERVTSTGQRLAAVRGGAA